MPQHVVTLSSALYGTEEFLYTSKREALKGMKRLLAKARAAAKKDGVKRKVAYIGKISP